MQNLIRFETMIVTPEVAQMWLEKNEGNRNIRRTHVLYLAGLIKRGEFKTTHQCIAFDAHGYLVDGQHRLSAVVEANMPVRMAVSHYGCLKDDVFNAIDSCVSVRTTSDITRLSPNEAAIARAFALGNSKEMAKYSLQKCSPEQILEAYQQHKESISLVYSYMTKKTAPSSVHMWYQFCLWYEAEPEEAKVFIDGYTRIRDDIQQANALRESFLMRVRRPSCFAAWTTGRTLYCIDMFKRGKKANLVSVLKKDLF